MLIRLAVSRIGVQPVSFLPFFFSFKLFSVKLVDTTPPHTYTSSHSCAGCCRRWVQLYKWYLHCACLHSFLIFVKRENCGLVMLIASLQKYIPDFYGGLTPLAAETTKDFFAGTHIYPEEYDGYCRLQCCSSFCIFSSPNVLRGMLFPIGNSYFQIWGTLFTIDTWCHALIFVSTQVDSA